jgi:leader peptidase (prepilin peptidase)/N-methyltransferase
MSCGKKLTWYENIPIISWVLQRGKCRKCGARIGKAEIIAELFGMVSFGWIVYRFIDSVPTETHDVLAFLGEINLLQLVIVLAMMVGLIILAVYDGKWQEMPTSILLYVVIMGLFFAVVACYQDSIVLTSNCPEGAQCFVGETEQFSLGVFGKNMLSYVWSVGLLAGIYFLLYLFSREKLVGGGDWILCAAIGLILGDWWLALMELFLSNFLGTIAMVGLKQKKAAFGPFLVIAFVVVYCLSDWLVTLH